MPRSKQNTRSESISLRALGASVAWILFLLAGYWLLADWQSLPALASSMMAL